VVYRPKTVVFETPVVVDEQVLQPVLMTDQDGQEWIAVYPMQRQPDGSWRTNGCQLARFAGTET
jgi:chlorite dismutase